MRPRSVVLLSVTVLIMGFAALNWQNMLTTAPINLVLVKIDAPLGIVLLLVVAFMLLLFFTLIAYLEAQARSERKRLGDDIERWRKLAEEAETSRITELREIIEAGFDDLYDRIQVGSPKPATQTPATVIDEEPVDAEDDESAADDRPAADSAY